VHTAAFGTLHRHTQCRRKIFDVWRDETFAAVVAGEDGVAEEHGVCRYYFSVNLLAS